MSNENQHYIVFETDTTCSTKELLELLQQVIQRPDAASVQYPSSLQSLHAIVLDIDIAKEFVTKPVDAKHLTQLNMIAVVERASELIDHMVKLQMPLKQMSSLATQMLALKKDDLDDWEELAWRIVWMELQERQIREEDPSVEKAPAGWNGGFPSK